MSGAAVIPVVDLKGGLVVRGVAGNRQAYLPVRSVLAPGSNALTIGKAFCEQFSASTVYVADLDAIAGNVPDWESYRQLQSCGLALWIDAGLDDAGHTASAGTPWLRLSDLLQSDRLERPLDRVIVGLESLPAANALASIWREFGSHRLMFSLDLKHGQPLTVVDAWRLWPALHIVAVAVEAGANSVIVLDLAGVGMRAGPVTAELCHQIRSKFPKIELISGGGVRSVSDIAVLIAAGCDAVLVSSALHDGTINAAAIDSLSAP